MSTEVVCKSPPPEQVRKGMGFQPVSPAPLSASKSSTKSSAEKPEPEDGDDEEETVKPSPHRASYKDLNADQLAEVFTTEGAAFALKPVGDQTGFGGLTLPFVCRALFIGERG